MTNIYIQKTRPITYGNIAAELEVWRIYFYWRFGQVLKAGYMKNRQKKDILKLKKSIRKETAKDEGALGWSGNKETLRQGN